MRAIKGQVMRGRRDLLELRLSRGWRWRAFFAQVNREMFCLVCPHEQTHLQDTGMPQPRSVTLHPGFVHAHEPLAMPKAFITVEMDVFKPTLEGSSASRAMLILFKLYRPGPRRKEVMSILTKDFAPRGFLRGS